MTSVSIPQEASLTKKAWYRSIYFQVIVAIILGIGFGHFHPEMAATMKPLADGFIKLVKMIIGPIIFCTIVHGVAGSDNLKQVGSVGIKALSYFMAMTILAMIIGLVVVNIQQPGVGMNIGNTAHEQEEVSADKSVVTPIAKSHNSTVDFLLNIIPKTMSSAFGDGNILQILLISLLCAFALAGMGEKGKPIVHGIEMLSGMFFSIVNMIVKLAPIGAFGAMAYTIGEHGIESLVKLMSLMLGFYITCFLFIFVVLWLVMRAVGLSLWLFLKYLKEEIFIVIGTSSSESVLPQMIEKLTKLGCNRSVAGMVIPTGYSFNLDGTAIYLTMGALFITQATNTPMGLVDQLSLLAILIITSKGAAGVTGSGFIVLAATLSTMNVMPAAILTIALAQVFAIDRFMSEARAVTNLIGNSVATLFVAKWEKALDMDVARKMLSER
ncbi:MAG: C4-dicarboxylate transporter DctA [Rickettsiales bacterium]|nr:C4-dicarboxylate transporter DctA [Rickettsiales bacterium]